MKNRECFTSIIIFSNIFFLNIKCVPPPCGCVRLLVYHVNITRNTNLLRLNDYNTKTQLNIGLKLKKKKNQKHFKSFELNCVLFSSIVQNRYNIIVCVCFCLVLYMYNAIARRHSYPRTTIRKCIRYYYCIYT